MGVVLVLGFVFWLIRWDRYPGVALNLVLADISLVLLCLILILGPAARFVPRVRPLVPWGRELGIGMFVTAGLHVLILLDGGWYVLGFFFEVNPFTSSREWRRALQTDIWSAANWVGLVALGYALVLAVTSNDWSQRLLGRGWKFLQRQTYTLFVLVLMHAVVWVLLGHGAAFMWWFFAFITLAVVAQIAGFVHTVRAPRGPSPQRAPSKTATTNSSSSMVRVAKWVAVTALWGGLIIGSWLMAAAESPELVRFCERYEEVQDLPRAEMLEELVEYVPTSDGDPAVREFVEECQDR